MDSKVETIISKVQKNLILYNTRDINYRNCLLVDKAWGVVSTNVQMSSK